MSMWPAAEEGSSHQSQTAMPPTVSTAFDHLLDDYGTSTGFQASSSCSTRQYRDVNTQFHLCRSRTPVNLKCHEYAESSHHTDDLLDFHSFVTGGGRPRSQSPDARLGLGSNKRLFSDESESTGEQNSFEKHAPPTATCSRSVTHATIDDDDCAKDNASYSSVQYSPEWLERNSSPLLSTPNGGFEAQPNVPPAKLIEPFTFEGMSTIEDSSDADTTQSLSAQNIHRNGHESLSVTDQLNDMSVAVHKTANIKSMRFGFAAGTPDHQQPSGADRSDWRRRDSADGREGGGGGSTSDSDNRWSRSRDHETAADVQFKVAGGFAQRTGSLMEWYVHKTSPWSPAFGGCVTNWCQPVNYEMEGDALDPANWLNTIQHKSVVGAVFGVHPHFADEWNEHRQALLLRRLQQPKCIAVGETGLDYSGINKVSSLVQEQSFVGHIKLAIESQKTLLLHCRNSNTKKPDERGVAEDRLFDILKQNAQPSQYMHRHCYVLGSAPAYRLMKEFPNLHFGLTPAILDTRPDDPLRLFVKEAPLDRLMFAHLGHSHPGFAIGVALEIAELKQRPVAEVIEQLTINTNRCYQHQLI